MPLNKMENSEIKSHHYTLTNFIVSEKTETSIPQSKTAKSERLEVE
jgi:hypothetical protein